MSEKTPSGILSFVAVPDDAGDADVKVYVNGELVESGGGGDSDFAIAKWTNTIANLKIVGCFIDEETIAPTTMSTEFDVGSYDLAMYKGSGVCYMDPSGVEYVEFTGDAEVDVDGTITYTGDFTISLKGNEE